MFRRMENASWRLWASAADASVCAPELLLELDKSDLVPQLKLTSSRPASHGRGRQLQDLHTVLKLEGLHDDRPSVVLHNWRVSTKETKVVVLDGQARSRRENQLWRLMAISRSGDARSQGIIRRVCVNSPTSALQLGEPLPTSPGVLELVSRTPSPDTFAARPSSMLSPSPISRTLLRTPSPEFRWAANARPAPILAPRITASPVQNQGMHMQNPANPSCYVRPVVAVPIAQVVGLVGPAPLQSGLCIKPVAAMPTMAVPTMRADMSTRPSQEDYVCVAVPKHLVPQIQEELSVPRQ